MKAAFETDAVTFLFVASLALKYLDLKYCAVIRILDKSKCILVF